MKKAEDSQETKMENAYTQRATHIRTTEREREERERREEREIPNQTTYRGVTVIFFLK
jgi:hypothetical protein